MNYAYERLREAAGRLLMFGRRWHEASRAGDRAAAAAARAEMDARVPAVAAACAAYAGPRPPGRMAEFAAAAVAYHGAATEAEREPFLDLVCDLCRTPTLEDFLGR
jgi:hypothetical protein